MNISTEMFQDLIRKHVTHFASLNVSGFKRKHVTHFASLNVSGFKRKHVTHFASLNVSGFKRKHVTHFASLNVSGFVALNISRLPGGPGRRSTTNPTACMARRTLPFAE